MSDDWTPTTEQVRAGYRSPFDSPFAREEFDRWLAKERIELLYAVQDAVRGDDNRDWARRAYGSTVSLPHVMTLLDDMIQEIEDELRD